MCQWSTCWHYCSDTPPSHPGGNRVEQHRSASATIARSSRRLADKREFSDVREHASLRRATELNSQHNLLPIMRLWEVSRPLYPAPVLIPYRWESPLCWIWLKSRRSVFGNSIWYAEVPAMSPRRDQVPLVILDYSAAKSSPVPPTHDVGEGWRYPFVSAFSHGSISGLDFEKS